MFIAWFLSLFLCKVSWEVSCEWTVTLAWHLRNRKLDTRKHNLLKVTKPELQLRHTQKHHVTDRLGFLFSNFSKILYIWRTAWSVLPLGRSLTTEIERKGVSQHCVLGCVTSGQRSGNICERCQWRLMCSRFLHLYILFLMKTSCPAAYADILFHFIVYSHC